MRQVGTDQAAPCGHRRYATGHRNIRRLADNLSHRDSAIVTTQAHQRVARRLARLRDSGRTRVGQVSCAWRIAVPEGCCRARRMRGVAKDADPVLGHGRHIARSRRRQVVRCIDDASGQCGGHGQDAREQRRQLQDPIHVPAPM